VRELKPGHPHVAERLAEAERQQQEASAPTPVGTTLAPTTHVSSA
jgi:hypothetical protein